MKSLYLLSAFIAFQCVYAVGYNCSMNVDVVSRSCQHLTCGVTGSYVAGQIVHFDCVNVGDTISGNPWWGRDPLLDFVPIVYMTGVDGHPCD
ncbi:hypothetical protein DL96DRAFT_1615889, partial [Flagelloscypha sp. PMI_526]